MYFLEWKLLYLYLIFIEVWFCMVDYTERIQWFFFRKFPKIAYKCSPLVYLSTIFVPGSNELILDQ